jgi:hypothetical protein
MTLKRSHLLMLLVLAVGGLLTAGEAQARHSTAPDLFYNYYVPGGPCGGVGAELYVCPRPTPPLVGHTWITYQPLMPHEYMYKHCRHYVRRNPGAGITCTKVSYGHSLLGSYVPPWMDGKICKHLLVNPFADYGKYYQP